jgi:hypothetical protein
MEETKLRVAARQAKSVGQRLFNKNSFLLQ